MNREREGKTDVFSVFFADEAGTRGREKTHTLAVFFA
jgi:hypothetical protein